MYTGSEGEIECGDDAESYIDLQPAEGNRVAVRSELIFFNAHVCDFESVGVTCRIDQAKRAGRGARTLALFPGAMLSKVGSRDWIRGAASAAAAESD